MFFSDDHQSMDVVVRFPWRKDPNHDAGASGPDSQSKPGEFIVQSLFLEYCRTCERKIEQVLAEPLVSVFIIVEQCWNNW